jgi:hypothetical protein
VLKRKQTLSANGAVVHANIIDPPVVACEGSFHSFLLRHPVFVGRKNFNEIVAAGFEPVVHPLCEFLEISPLEGISLCVLVDVVRNQTVECIAV